MSRGFATCCDRVADLKRKGIDVFRMAEIATVAICRFRDWSKKKQGYQLRVLRVTMGEGVGWRAGDSRNITTDSIIWNGEFFVLLSLCTI